MRININKLLEDKRAMICTSIAIAVVLWFAVVLSVDTAGEHTIHDVPVRIDAATSTASQLRLRPLLDEENPLRVSVTISGKRSVIGNVTADDILVTANLSAVTRPDSYLLYFVGSDPTRRGFEVVDISPVSAEVQFDEWTTKSVSVTVQSGEGGISIPDEYIMGNILTSPEQIELLGPESILSRIEYCIIQLDFTSPLDATYNDTHAVQFLDGEGYTVDYDPAFVSLSHTEAQVTIPVLKKKTLPITVDFTNEPGGFDRESLSYVLSEDEIVLAGPEDVIDRMDAYVLEYVDMRQLEPGTNLTFDVGLPSGFMNISDVEAITVEFELANYEVREYTIASSNIKLINVPAGYDVTASTRQIRSVKIVGPTAVLRTLTAADLVAEIDMNDFELVMGEITVPVKVRSTEYDDVWATGNYSAVITVRER